MTAAFLRSKDSVTTTIRMMPCTTCCTMPSMPVRDMPLFRMAMATAPITAERKRTVQPPDSGIPPKSTASSTSNSKALPVPDEAVQPRISVKKPTRPHTTPERTKAIVRTLLQRTPD